MPTPLTPQPRRGSYLYPSLQDATVGEAMHPGILACTADLPLRAVAGLMASNRVHCIAITGNSAGERGEAVWGIVSDLDVVRTAIREGFDRTAGELALEPAVTIDAAASLSDAGELMLTRCIHHLVVIAPGSARPIGVLSSLDIASVIAAGEL
ncbi:MAG: CBS domain-containing protein [Actinomycetota bacterium]|nr:CBS domain-containing protein [Actinomycetota bacterium]